MGYDSFKKKDSAEDELIVGTEHNTMYYYRLKGKILYLLGHENPSVKLQYTEPVPVMYYPISFGEPEKGMVYTSKGLYSSTIKMSTEGTSGIVADAFGKMVLPTGDTISPVLRIKTIGDTHRFPRHGLKPTNGIPKDTAILFSKRLRVSTCKVISGDSQRLSTIHHRNICT